MCLPARDGCCRTIIISEMRWSLLAYSLFTALLLSACSQIDESERFIYVEPSGVARAVLIEDFTGQRCINCPTAASEIERLQKEYGEENVIAVSIHSGPLAVFSNEKVKGLRTELGDTYYSHWNIRCCTASAPPSHRTRNNTHSPMDFRSVLLLPVLPPVWSHRG